MRSLLVHLKNMLLWILFSSIPIICSNCKPNRLSTKVQSIELSYIAWGCECANWATSKDIERYHDSGDKLAERSIFIEPADRSLELPDTLGFTGDLIRFTGSFYEEKGYPEGYRSEQNPDRSRVFRYTKYKVIRSQYKYVKEDLRKGPGTED